MTSDFQARLIDAISKRNLACPNLEVRETASTVSFIMPRNAASVRYSGSATYEAQYYTDLAYFEKDFTRTVKDVSKLISDWKQQDAASNRLSTTDAFFGISGQGTIEMPYEVDRVLINTLERAGIDIGDLLRSIQWVLDRESCNSLNEMRDIAVSSFTNKDPLHMKKYFYNWYRRLNELEGMYRHALPFQGCLCGSQNMAFDIRLALGIHYKSSVSPTITMRNQEIPESMLASLKGMKVNDLLDRPMFNDHVVVRNAIRGATTINLNITPDRVDITHMGRQVQHLKKAA